ncbi:serum amyloid P-component-like [Mustelus asterias]
MPTPIPGRRTESSVGLRQDCTNLRRTCRHTLAMKTFLLLSIACLITPLVIGEEREGLVEESLLFLTDSRSEHVVLSLSKEMSLSDLTLCLRFNTELRSKHVLFSSRSADLLLAREDDRTMRASFGGKELRFRLPADLWGWVHVCAVRDAKAGLASLYINGEPTARKPAQGSAAIALSGRVILGHQEDRIGQEPSYVGEMVDVNLWDRVLAPSTIRRLARGESDAQGSVISWLTAKIQTKGNVVVQRSTRVQ